MKDDDTEKSEPKVVQYHCEVCHCPLSTPGGYDWTGMCYQCAHEEARFGHDDDEERDD